MVAATKFFLASLEIKYAIIMVLIRSVLWGQGRSRENAPEMSGNVREFKSNLLCSPGPGGRGNNKKFMRANLIWVFDWCRFSTDKLANWAITNIHTAPTLALWELVIWVVSFSCQFQEVATGNSHVIEKGHRIGVVLVWHYICSRLEPRLQSKSNPLPNSHKSNPMPFTQ